MSFLSVITHPDGYSFVERANRYRASSSQRVSNYGSEIVGRVREGHKQPLSEETHRCHHRATGAGV